MDNSSNVLDLDLEIDTAKTVLEASIPDGQYRIYVNTAQHLPTKAGTGYMIKVQLMIISDECKGKFLYHSFNYKNDNQMAQKIGLEQLKKFTLACFGFDQKITNVGIFFDKTCFVTVKSKEWNGEMRPNITGFARDSGDIIPTIPAPAKGNLQPMDDDCPF